MTGLPKLFEPIKIGTMELPNRIIFPAITTAYDSNYDVKGDERSEYFYAERARGGAALLIIGALQALWPGRREPPRVNINSDTHIPHLRRWTSAVHAAGGRAAAQLAVWNLWSKGGEGTTALDYSPSGVNTIPEGGFPQDLDHPMFIPETHILTIEDILMIEDEVARSAVRARESGFDAIELPAVSGNLFSRFITPYTNRRTDRYGGTWENRARFLSETITAIKKKAGDDLPIIVRVSGADLLSYGLTLDEAKIVAPFIEKAGAHAINVHAGWYETRQPRYVMSVPHGAFVYLAEGIKQVVRIPVCTNNRINDPRLAEQILEEGRADLIGMGRPLIADPELPIKAREGRFDDIRKCTACCGCFDDIMDGKPIMCSVNPVAGNERQCAITKALVAKKVFVVGGGPAGMEAARVAALRGHHVTLFEKSDRLGGDLLYAVLPPHKEEWNALREHLVRQIEKLKVKVNVNADGVKAVESGKPDAVIVATGALPVVPNIPGIRGKNVAAALDVLAGRREVGKDVAIVGGGLIGCETAEFLASRGKKVTILEMLPRIGNDVGHSNRYVLLDRLEAAGVVMAAGARVEEITDTGVRVTRSGRSVVFPADSVVIAVGMKADKAAALQLKGKAAVTWEAGDCVEARRIKQAMNEGYRAGLAV